jgi:hypothetical protein
MTDLKVIDGGPPADHPPTKRAPRKPADKPTTMFDLEPHLCEAERLAEVIGKFHLDRLCGNELHQLPADQYHTLIEVLLDKLRAETS